MPLTYLLTSDRDRRTAEKAIDNTFPTLILKKNIQRKEGLFLSDDALSLKNQIKDNEFVIAQHYLQNTLTCKGHKLNLRLYFLVVREAQAQVSGETVPTRFFFPPIWKMYVCFQASDNTASRV